MKTSYEAYMHGIKPSAEFCTALEAKMKQALYGSKRRRNPLYIGVAVTATIMVAILLTVTLNKPDIEDNVIQSVPVATDSKANDEFSLSNNSVEPISEDVVQSAPIIIMPISEDRAIELVKQADLKAAEATQFFVYPENVGAWVFYTTGAKGACSVGAFWYVSEAQSTPIGSYTENVLNWNYLALNPGIMTSTIRSGDRNVFHAAILKNGVPYELTELHGITGLYEQYGSLTGTLDVTDNDFAFLSLDGNELREISAISIDESAVSNNAGIYSILNAVKAKYIKDDVAYVDYLYRPATSDGLYFPIGSTAGSIAVNLTINGAPHHFYIWLDKVGVANVLGEGTWGESDGIDVAIFEGYASNQRDVGFSIIVPNISNAGNST